MKKKPTSAELQRQSAADWEKATISDAFVFNRVMMKKEILRPTLQRILPELAIQDIIRINTELTIKHARKSKGFRLDVAAIDNQRRQYDIEMQVVNQHNLVERSLAYFAGMVEEQLESGDRYVQLRPIHVIFLTKFDPLGKKKQFDRLELFSPFDFKAPLAAPLLVFTFIDVTNDQPATPEPVRRLCRFINDGTVDPTDPYILKLKERESFAKQNAKWRNIYMHIDLNQKFQEWQKQREIDEAVDKTRAQEREAAAEKEAKAVSAAIKVFAEQGEGETAIVAKLVQIFGLSKGQAEDYYRHTMTPA